MSLSFRQYWRILATYLQSLRWQMLLLTVLVFASIGLQLLNPQIARQFIDAVQTDTPTELLTRLAIAFIGVALLSSVTNLAVTYVSETVSWAATNALRTDLTAHCMGLDMSFHHQQTPGTLIERVDGDVTVLGRFFSELFVRALANLLTLLGILVLLFQEGWQIGTAFTFFGMIAFVILIRLGDIATPYLKATREATADLFGFIEERLGGTEDIRANGAIGYTMQQLYRLTAVQWRRHIRGALRNAIFGSVIVVWFDFGSVLALALGAILYSTGTITLGTIYLLYAYVRMLSTPIMMLTQETQRLQEASAAILRVEELLEIQPDIRDNPQIMQMAQIKEDKKSVESAQSADRILSNEKLPDSMVGSVDISKALSLRFEQVSFTYKQVSSVQEAEGEQLKIDKNEKQSSPVLKQLSFDLPAGQTLGIVGRTGSGKSTIARLLVRLYDPESGTIRLGDRDIRTLPISVLRQQVAIVTQDVHLFNSSIRENLTLFDPSIPDDLIRDVIDQVGLTKWFTRQSDGLDTLLQRGSGLSAGEAQLLAFARVFLRKSKLVILDEASSRLDPVTERLIEIATQRLVAGRTAVIIAHRLSTLDRVDRIMVLEQGEIVEYGPREQLAADIDSRFAQLLKVGGQHERI